MGKIHKLTKGGQTIYPATVTDAVVNPNTRKSLTAELAGLGVQTNGIILFKNVMLRGYYNGTDGIYTPGGESFRGTPKIPKEIGNSFSFFKDGMEYNPYSVFVWKSNSFRKLTNISTIELKDDDIAFAVNIPYADINSNIYIKCNDVNKEIVAIKNKIENFDADVNGENVILVGKNLFDLSKTVNGYIDKASGKITAYSYPDAVVSNKINITPGNTYAISGRFDTNAAVGYDEDGNIVKIITNRPEYSVPVMNGIFTVSPDSKAVQMQFTCRLQDNDISKIQFEKGHAITDFEPYEETCLPQKMDEVTQKVNDNSLEVERNTKDIVFSGNDFDGATWFSAADVGEKVIKYSNASAVSVYGISIPTKKGDVWSINTLGGSGTGRAWILADSGNNVLSLAGPSLDTLTEGLKLEISDDNASVLYINCSKGTTINKDTFNVLLISSIAGRMYLLEKSIFGLFSSSPLYKKKYCAFGSSSTENWTPYYGVQGSYAQRVADRNRMDFRNLGVSGYTMANPDKREHTILTQILSVNEPQDYCTIMAGANDIITGGVTYQGVKVEPTETSDFYGAYKAGINHLLSINPACRIGIIVPFSIPPTVGFNKIRTAVHEIGEYYGIPVLDINNYGFDGIYSNSRTHYTAEQMRQRKAKLGEPNGSQHLNNDGMKILSYIVEHFMNGL